MSLISSSTIIFKSVKYYSSSKILSLFNYIYFNITNKKNYNKNVNLRFDILVNLQ